MGRPLGSFPQGTGTSGHGFAYLRLTMALPARLLLLADSVRLGRPRARFSLLRSTKI